MIAGDINTLRQNSHRRADFQPESSMLLAARL
jgi:hypothetical protein